MNKASCLGPLSNAAVLQNTVHIERAVVRLQVDGTKIDPADLAHVWPLQRARIISNGTYFFNWPQGEMAEDRTSFTRVLRLGSPSTLARVACRMQQKTRNDPRLRHKRRSVLSLNDRCSQ